MWIFLCLSNIWILIKPWPQKSQVKGFWLPCSRTECEVKWSALENLSRQVWVSRTLKGILLYLLFRIIKAHTLHWNGSNPLWILVSWRCFLVYCLNPCKCQIKIPPIVAHSRFETMLTNQVGLFSGNVYKQSGNFSLKALFAHSKELTKIRLMQ